MLYVCFLVSWRKMERNIIQYLFYVWLDNLFLKKCILPSSNCCFVICKEHDRGLDVLHTGCHV